MLGDTGIADRTSADSDAAGEADFLDDGVFPAGELFFFFFPFGVGDFFFGAVFFVRFALGDALGEGVFRGFGVGVGLGFDLPVFLPFPFVDLALPTGLGEDVGLTDSALGVFEGSLVCA
jgi:hypothetical protein